jgi:hypothetical protein
MKKVQWTSKGPAANFCRGALETVEKSHKTKKASQSFAAAAAKKI